MARARRELPSKAYLHECFMYDPDSGLLMWQERPYHHFADHHAGDVWNARFPGTIIGTAHRTGYVLATLNAKQWAAHRVIWKWMTDTDVPEIDHINGVRSDNRWINLRDAGPNGNNRNRKCDYRNEFGLKGVQRSPKSSRYRAYIRLNGKRHVIGYFATPEEAHAAYCAAAQRHYGEFWNPG